MSKCLWLVTCVVRKKIVAPRGGGGRQVRQCLYPPLIECECMWMQMTSEHVCQLQSDKMDCQAGQNRCPLATPDGGFDDELGDRPYRCHVCHVGFKLKVLIANIDFVVVARRYARA